MILFHGTNRAAANIIKTKGFKAFVCSDYGKAVYFSDLPEWAEQYGTEIIKANIEGNILDFGNPEHWQEYLKNGITKEIDALKDGHIIAVFKPNKIKIIN